MNSAVSTPKAAGTHRPRVGMALIAALLLGGLVAAGAYAQRSGVLSMSDPGLTQSAAMRAQLASGTIGVAKAKHHHASLLAWHAPKVPKITKVTPRVITPPPRVVTISAPAPAPAPAPQPAAAAATSAPAPVAAPAPTTQHEDGNGGGSDD
jgi:hypothetical protein